MKKILLRIHEELDEEIVALLDVEKKSFVSKAELIRYLLAVGLEFHNVPVKTDYIVIKCYSCKKKVSKCICKAVKND